VKKDRGLEMYHLTPQGHDWCLEIYPSLWAQDSE